MIGRFLPGLAALSRYQRSWLQYDLVAGVSVAAVAMPIAIAYSQLAGVPPAHGLYASILPLVAYALFGSSRQLIMAPDAATCAIVAATVAPLAAQDPARYISLSMALAIDHGRPLHRGGLGAAWVPDELPGAAHSDGLSEWHRAQHHQRTTRQVVRVHRRISRASFACWRSSSRTSAARTVLTLGLGVATFVLLRMLKRVAPKIPGPLVAVAAGIAASSLFRLGDRGVALLGAIPAGFRR